jgi:hypothetical protein
VISIAALVCAFFIRNTRPPADGQPMEYGPAAGEEPVSEESAARRS